MTRLISTVKKELRHYPSNLRPLRALIKRFGFLRNDTRGNKGLYPLTLSSQHNNHYILHHEIHHSSLMTPILALIAMVTPQQELESGWV
jgi:hypothetical protein